MGTIRIFALCFLLVSPESGASRAIAVTPLKFLLMVASDSNPDSSAVVPAVDQTLEEINKNTSILPGHHLKYVLRESKCNRITALDNFFGVATDSSIVAVVGCGCSAATEEVARVSHYQNKSLISYASTSVVLSDRSVYRSFFRTVPSDELLVSAVATVMEFNLWRQLSVFAEQQPQYLELTKQLQQRLNEQNVTVSTTKLQRHLTLNYAKLANGIQTVFDAQPHIFLSVGTLRTQALTLCAAYHNGRYYPNYAWILLGHHETDWWREYYMETNCSDTDMMKVLNRSLILIPYPDDETKQTSIQDGDLYNVSAYASDAVRALAEALHNCYNKEGSGNSNSSCSGTELDWNITFPGRTGSVRFDLQNGNRKSSRNVVQQYQSQSNYRLFLKSVAILKGPMVIPLTVTSIWPDGVPPDGTPIFVIFNNIQVPVAFVYSTLAVVVLVTAAVCLTFNIVFRKRKIVKLTSPTLNYFLIFGTVIMTVANILEYPRSDRFVVGSICTVNSFFSSVGYDIVIGIAIAKTWRVYYIFKNPTPNKKVVKDWHLLMVVLLIAMMEIIIAAPLLTLALLKGDVAAVTNTEPTLNSQGVTETLLSYTCGNSKFFLIFLGLTVFYKILLHTVALLLSQLISRVKVNVLNDSRETVVAIFATTVLLLLGILGLLTLISIDKGNAYIAWAVMIFLVAVVNLMLAFIPKMVALYKDPKGEKVFEKVKQDAVELPIGGCHSFAHSTTSTECESELNSLKEKVTQLELELCQYKNTND